MNMFDSEWLHSRRLAEKPQEDEAKEDSTLNKEGVIFWNAEQIIMRFVLIGKLCTNWFIQPSS